MHILSDRFEKHACRRNHKLYVCTAEVIMLANKFDFCFALYIKLSGCIVENKWKSQLQFKTLSSYFDALVFYHAYISLRLIRSKTSSNG